LRSCAELVFAATSARPYQTLVSGNPWHGRRERPLRRFATGKNVPKKAAAPDPTCIATSAPLVSGFELGTDARDWVASRTSVRALLASEAGRAARAAVAQHATNERLDCLAFVFAPLRCLTRYGHQIDRLHVATSGHMQPFMDRCGFHI